MSVRSTNNSGSGLINRSLTQDKPATTAAPEKNPAATPEKLPFGLPDRLQNSFERSGNSTRTFGKTWDVDRPMHTPKLGTSGLGGMISGLLGKLPRYELAKGSFEKGVSVFNKQGTYGNENIGGNYKLSLLEASASGSGSVTFADGKLNAHGELHGQATLLDAAADFKAKLGPAYAEGQAHAWVGAKANLAGDLTIDPSKGIYGIEAGGDAFIGARAGASGKVSFGDYGGVGGSAEAWAGLGVSAKASAKLENGRFKARFELGAALGIGFKLGFNVDINFKKIGEGIKNILNKPVQIAKDVVKGVGDFFKNTGSKIAEGVKNVGNAIADGVKSVGKAIGDGVKKIFSGW
ncbi:MAG: hypothetical protein JXB05_14555 [Myxococcaceae bacterium]|nr:hypothetical protein [Myxococcaceae bacterium]